MSAARFPQVDVSLAQRLERVEGQACAAIVDARRSRDPHVGAEWIEAAGAFAMFDGATSPLTQSFGVGLQESFTAVDLDAIEAFFARHGCVTAHEVSSFVQPATLNLLSVRGYAPIEASTVLVRPAAPTVHADSGRITVRVVDDSETDLWARISGDGLRTESAELGTFVDEFGQLLANARGVHRFLAELDGKAIATASLTLVNGVALFGGASTIPEARRQGAQRALLESRLAFADEQGTELAMIVTTPGTASQRNAVRHGFRAVYTRSKWQQGAVLLT